MKSVRMRLNDLEITDKVSSTRGQIKCKVYQTKAIDSQLAIRKRVCKALRGECLLFIIALLKGGFILCSGFLFSRITLPVFATYFYSKCSFLSRQRIRKWDMTFSFGESLGSLLLRCVLAQRFLLMRFSEVLMVSLRGEGVGLIGGRMELLFYCIINLFFIYQLNKCQFSESSATFFIQIVNRYFF